MAQAPKFGHELNSLVIVKINERAQHMLVPARYLVTCTQEQLQGINFRLLVYAV